MPTGPSTPRSTRPLTSTPATGSTAAGVPATLCPASAAPQDLLSCLRASVGEFWSGQLNQVVDQKVVIDPAPAAVPAGCRPGLKLGTAFTCQIDGALYLTASFRDLISRHFSGPDLFYAYASLAAHEIGHVVQAAVDQPHIHDDNPTQAQSQQLEQQADCLGGVWAATQSANGRLDPGTYERDSVQLITLISSPAEISGHGTPDQRRRAIEKGLTGRTPQSCALATFS